MTSKFIYKVIRIKAGFVLIIIIYNCSKGEKKEKKNPASLLFDRQAVQHTICSYQCFILSVNTLHSTHGRLFCHVDAVLFSVQMQAFLR